MQRGRCCFLAVACGALGGILHAASALDAVPVPLPGRFPSAALGGEAAHPGVNQCGPTCLSSPCGDGEAACQCSTTWTTTSTLDGPVDCSGVLSSSSTTTTTSWDHADDPYVDAQPHPEPYPDDIANAWNPGSTSSSNDGWDAGHGRAGWDAQMPGDVASQWEGHGRRWEGRGRGQDSTLGGSAPRHGNARHDRWDVQTTGGIHSQWEGRGRRWDGRESWQDMPDDASAMSSSSGWHGAAMWAVDRERPGRTQEQRWGWQQPQWDDTAQTWRGYGRVPAAPPWWETHWDDVRGGWTPSGARSSWDAPRVGPSRTDTNPSGGKDRPRYQAPGFWRAGQWVPRPRTASEERLHRGGQGPVRAERRNARVAAWMDGSFRPAAFRRGVPDLHGPEMRDIRAQMAAALRAGAPLESTPRSGERWTLQQWEDWERWNNPALVVDWSGRGLPGWQFMAEDDTDDDGVFMQLTDGEEDLLHRLHVPDAVRRDMRDMLRTLQNHQDEDVGAEYRWGLHRWLQAWSRGCAEVERVIEILRERVGGPVPYYPVLRRPRALAQRARCVAFNRQWSAVVMPLLEALVDAAMIGEPADTPASPSEGSGRATGSAEETPRPRSRSPLPSRSASSSSSSSTRFRITRTARVVGRRSPSTTPATMAGDTDVDAAGSGPGPGATGGPPLDPVATVDCPTDAEIVDEAVVTGCANADSSSLVQRLQTPEATWLMERGVRRQTVDALGRFLDGLASAGADGHRDMDIATVQWCLHVTDRAIQRAMAMQDEVVVVLARRLCREGDLDEEQRGEAAQAAHEARTYLLALHDSVSEDPECLPDHLRGRGNGDEGRRSRSRTPPRAIAGDSPVNVLVNAGQVASSSGSSLNVDGAASVTGVSDDVVDGSGVSRAEDDGDVSGLMQTMNQNDVAHLEDCNVGAHCIHALGELLDRLRRAREAAAEHSDVGWQVGVLVQSLRSTSEALSGLCRVLQERLHEVRRLPSVTEREELLRMSGEFLRATTEMVEDMLHMGVAVEEIEPLSSSTTSGMCPVGSLAFENDLLCRRADGRSRSPVRRGIPPDALGSRADVGLHPGDGDDFLVPGSSLSSRVPYDDVSGDQASSSPTTDVVMFHVSLS